jgi:hypothetical protein
VFSCYVVAVIVIVVVVFACCCFCLLLILLAIVFVCFFVCLQGCTCVCVCVLMLIFVMFHFCLLMYFLNYCTLKNKYVTIISSNNTRTLTILNALKLELKKYRRMSHLYFFLISVKKKKL